MNIQLRKITEADIGYFSRWWRDVDLIKLTSGSDEKLSNENVRKYFSDLLKAKSDKHFMIVCRSKTIGHIALIKRDLDWYETQIVIGEKEYWGKGYGSEAIKLLMDEAKKTGIHKIYLEVRLDNERAIRSYEKCGFQKKGLINYPENPNLPVTSRMECLI